MLREVCNMLFMEKGIFSSADTIAGVLPHLTCFQVKELVGKKLTRTRQQLNMIRKQKQKLRKGERIGNMKRRRGEVKRRKTQLCFPTHSLFFFSSTLSLPIRSLLCLFPRLFTRRQQTSVDRRAPLSLLFFLSIPTEDFCHRMLRLQDCYHYHYRRHHHRHQRNKEEPLLYR